MERAAGYYNDASPADIASWSDDKLKDYLNTKFGFGSQGGDVEGASDALAKEMPGDGSRSAPIDLKTPADLAHAVSRADQTSSPEQGAANNAPRVHVTWNDIPITLETAGPNNVRRGTDDKGAPWEQPMGAPSGYFLGTVGRDGDHVDVSVGTHLSSPTVYVIDEKDKESGGFKQHKVYIGMQTPAEAFQTYIATGGKKAEQVGGMRSMSVPDLKTWLKSGDTKSPLSDSMKATAKAKEESVLPEETSAAPPEPGPEHVQAVEGALRAAGIPPEQVRPADIHTASEIHATEGAPPADAYIVGVARNLIKDGHIPRADAEKVIGDVATKDLLEPEQDNQRGAPAATPGTSASRTATEAAGRGGEVGAENGAGPPRPENAEPDVGKKPTGNADAGEPGETGGAVHTANRRSAADNAAGGERPAAGGGRGTEHEPTERAGEQVAAHGNDAEVATGAVDKAVDRLMAAHKEGGHAAANKLFAQMVQKGELPTGTTVGDVADKYFGKFPAGEKERAHAQVKGAEPSGLIGEPVKSMPEHTVTAADGTKVRVVPIIVPRSKIITSSDEGYDQEIQPRERDRAASQAQVREIATRLDPERLGQSAEADRGAPIVNSKGMVVSGNGRVLAIDQAREKKLPGAQRYQKWIDQQRNEDTPAHDDDILVRQIVPDMQPAALRAFAIAANQPTTLAMSAPERAMADADHLTTRVLDLIKNGTNLASAENRPFVRAFFAALPATERSALANKEGALSAEGLTRVKNAVLAKAYNDADVVSRITESTDDDIRSISNGLVIAAPAWAKFRDSIESGKVRRDLDATPQLMDAVKRVADLRARGENLEKFLAQHDAFDQLSEPVLSWMRLFYDPHGKRVANAASISDGLTFYAQDAAKVTTEPRLGLDIPEVTTDDLQRRALEKAQGLPAGHGTSNGPHGNAVGPQAGGRGVGESGEGSVRQQRRGTRLADERPDLFSEPGADGKPQLVIPGAEPISSAELAKRRSAEPLKAKAAQKASDEGLFAPPDTQVDLEEAIAKAPEKVSTAATSIENTVPTTDLFGTESDHGSTSGGIRQGAPQVSARKPAGGARGKTPRRNTPQLSLFGGEDSAGNVRTPASGGEQPAPSAELALSPESISVTKPPAISAGTSAARPDIQSRPRRDGLDSARKKIAERSRLNYRITDDDHIGEGGPKAKVRGNLEAIQILKMIEDEGRQATPEEKAKLVKYVGWGSVAQELFSTYGEHAQKWKPERDTLVAALTDEEYEAAKGSTLNAHYTSPDVIRGMWGALDHLGFKGGLALEPSAGIGHFIGLIPDKVAPKTAWTAVELDPITGRIAKALYGGAEVNVQGYQDLKRPSNYYDLAVSNVPFGDYNISEKPYGPHSIHDFFFIKSIDKVRPGGVVAFITSRYTMDKVDDSVRRTLARSADLIGAIRLPGGKKGAFASNAGTEVTTDIIFLRKKVPGEGPLLDRAKRPVSWMNLKEIQTKDGPTKINEYFVDHQHMMLGEMRLQGTQYRKDEPVLFGNTEYLDNQIVAAATNTMAPGVMVQKAAKPPPETLHSNDIEGPVKDGAFFVQKGNLYQKRNGAGVEQSLGADDSDRVTRLAGMRDTVNSLLDAQLRSDATASGVHRQLLGTAYKAFVAKWGPINKEISTVTKRLSRTGEPVVITKQPNLKPFLPDPDAWKVAAIEVYDSETGKAKPADIQTKDVIEPPKARSIDSPGDALASSLDKLGAVDLDHIADALNVDSHDEVVARMGDLIYQNPDGRKWETADTYLSGNVVSKLEQARAIAKEDPAYKRNVDALEKAQPELLTRSDISAQFGAPWIPEHVYEDFLKKALGASEPTVARVPITSEWRVQMHGVSRDAQSKYGTDRVEVKKIVQAALNNQQVTVYDRTSDDKSVVNAEETQKARIKTEALKEAFAGDLETGAQGWAWDDNDRALELEGIYNRTYNNLVPYKANGSHLSFPGLNPMFTDRQHRKDAVWRMIQRGNTLLAHVVGSGKTVTMLAGGMEEKRLGLINKPAYVVPNHMLEQFSREFLQAYPAAKILVAQKDEVTRENRKEFIAKAAANDWDGIIITHDAFGRINMDRDFREGFIREQLAEIARVMEAEAGQNGKSSPTVKGLEKAKKRLEDKLGKLMNEERKDTGISFEETGIDKLYIDEAHKFKNLSFITRMQRVKGLAQGDSQRAEDLFLKIRYLEQKRPGRSAVFATGTPVSNTMAELWTMQRYLQLEALRERDLDTFDAWASTFGRVVNNMELSADGRTLKEVSSFSKFVNVPELISLYSEVADTKTADMLNLPRPEVRGPDGKPGIEIIEAQPSEAEEKYIQSLVELAEKIKGKRPEKGQPNMLSVVTRGRKVATDGRLVGINEINPNGKISLAVKNIYDIWKNGTEPGMVQMVFLDMGVPQTRAKAKIAAPVEDNIEDEGAHEANLAPKVDLYADLKSRVAAMGIPAKQIAFIHDATDDRKKADLFERTRNGQVRVIVGSSEKMGVGTNAQTRIIAMHHLDAPWKPAEVEQRDGRMVRQGNLNPSVRILRYVTKRSFDAFMWQKLDTKSKFIGQVLSGAKGSRHAEDIDNPLPEAAEMKAAASGDPRILEHAEADRLVRQLVAQKRVFDEAKSRAAWQEGAAKASIAEHEKVLPKAKSDAAQAQDLGGDNFKVTIDDKQYTDRKEAGAKVLKKVLQLEHRDFYRPQLMVIGDMSGFKMNLGMQTSWVNGEALFHGQTSLHNGAGLPYTGTDINFNAQTDPAGIMSRYLNVLNNIRGTPAYYEQAIKTEKENLVGIAKMLKEAFPKQKELEAAQAKLHALTEALMAKPEDPNARIDAGGRAGHPPGSGGPVVAAQAKFLKDKGITWEEAAFTDDKHRQQLEAEFQREHPGVDKPLVDVEQFKPSDIQADPQRFQYREGVVDEQSGVTNKPMLPGWKQNAPMVVWQDKAGKDFVVDGHHRLDIAKRMEADGQDVKVRAITLKEADGITPGLAKAFGQRRNEWREANRPLRAIEGLDDYLAAVRAGPASSEAGMPIRVASSAETGIQAPGRNSSYEAPPGTQPVPGSHVSTFEEPSGRFTTRETPPSIFEGPAITTKFSDFRLGDTDSASNKRIIQGTNDINALVAAAEQNKAPYLERLENIVRSIPGAKVYASRVKDLPGLLDKIKSKGRAPNTISDYLGARIVVDSPEAMHAIIDVLDRTGGVLEKESSMAEPKAGYRAFHLQVGLGDGTSAELQIVPRPVSDVMAEAHAIRQPVKRLEKSKNPTETAEFERVMASVQNVFDDAWAKAPADWHGATFAEQAPKGWERADTSTRAKVLPGLVVKPSETFNDLGPYRFNPAQPIGQQAQSYVHDRGVQTGLEHILAVNDKGETLLHGNGTAKHTGRSIRLTELLLDPNSNMVIHHNHPSNNGLSVIDFAQLAMPGLKSIWAHGHGGNVTRASATPEGKTVLAKLGEPQQVRDGMIRIGEVIGESVRKPLQALIESHVVNIKQAEKLYGFAIGQVLHRSGLIDYSTTDGDKLQSEINDLGLEPYIEKAARTAAGVLFHEPGRATGYGANRPTQPVRHVGDLGATFGRVAPYAGEYRNAPRTDIAGRTANRPQAATRQLGFGFAEGTEPPEKVISAAVSAGGRIFTGVLHSDAWGAAERAFPYDYDLRQHPEDEGYVTSTGRFVDREEAWEIAQDRNQIVDKEDGPNLASENLKGWDDADVDRNNDALVQATATHPDSAHPNEYLTVNGRPAWGIVVDNKDHALLYTVRYERALDADFHHNHYMPEKLAKKVSKGTAEFIYGDAQGIQSMEPISADMRKSVAKYYGKAPEPTGFADMGAIFKSPGYKKLADNIAAKFASDTATILKEGLSDYSHRMKIMENNVEALFNKWVDPNGDLPDAHQFHALKRLFPGKVGDIVKDFNKEHFVPLDRSLRKNGITEVQAGDYLYAKHAEERNRVKAALYAQPQFYGTPQEHQFSRAARDPNLVGASGMSTAEARAIVAKAEKGPKAAGYADLRKRVAEIRKFTSGEMLRTGLEGPDAVSEWARTYTDYVPLKEWDNPEEAPDNANNGRGRGRGDIRGPENKYAFGRRSKADNPLIHIISQASRTIDRGERNVVLNGAARAFAGLQHNGVNLGRDLGVHLNRGRPVRKIDPNTGLATTIDSAMDRFGNNAVQFKNTGRPLYMVFDDPRVADAFRRWSPASLWGPLKAVQWTTNKMKSLWTHYSPTFIVRHNSRYFIEGLLNSFELKETGPHSAVTYTKQGFPLIGEATRAIFARERGEPAGELGQHYDILKRQGAFMAMRTMRDIDQLKDDMRIRLNDMGRAKRNPIKIWHDAVQAMNDVSSVWDNAQRLTTGSMALKQGKTPQQAAILARDATIDYQFRGLWSNMMGIWEPFFNTALRTGFRMGGAVKRSHIMRNVFFGTIAMGLAASAWNYLIGGKDTDGVPFFDKIPPWERNKGFILLNPWNTDAKGRPMAIKWPFPYNWSFPLSMGYGFGNFMFGRNETIGGVLKDMFLKPFLSTFSQVGEEGIGVRSVVPELLRPEYDVARNTNWKDRPVHQDQAFQNKPNAWSGFKNKGDYVRTGEGWKEIAQFLNGVSGGSRVKSGYFDFYPEDIREVFNPFIGTQLGFGNQIIKTVKSIAEGGLPASAEVPIGHLFYGQDYDAADIAARGRAKDLTAHPWKR
jgi:N12 class adenine-specific DNA methylase